MYCFSIVTIVTRKCLSVTFTNIFIPSYDVCTAATYSRLLTVMVLKPLGKMTTAIETAVTLMNKLAYVVCKELLGLTP